MDREGVRVGGHGGRGRHRGLGAVPGRWRRLRAGPGTAARRGERGDRRSGGRGRRGERRVQPSPTLRPSHPACALHGRALYLYSRFTLRYMMEGLDETFCGCVFLGYHAEIATPGILSQTYNPRAIVGVRINGTTT